MFEFIATLVILFVIGLLIRISTLEQYLDEQTVETKKWEAEYWALHRETDVGEIREARINKVRETMYALTGKRYT